MSIEERYYMYILASLSGTPYIGITNNLERRMTEHKEGLVSGFTRQYGLCRLVYFEVYGDVRNAIGREKQLKGWRRENEDCAHSQHESGLEGPG